MPNFQLDYDNKVITIDFTEAEYKALSWQDEDPLIGIKKRIQDKVEYAWNDAVKQEVKLNIENPDMATMPANEEELILSSIRQTVKEKKDWLVSQKLTTVNDSDSQ